MKTCRHCTQQCAVSMQTCSSAWHHLSPARCKLNLQQLSMSYNSITLGWEKKILSIRIFCLLILNCVLLLKNDLIYFKSKDEVHFYRKTKVPRTSFKVSEVCQNFIGSVLVVRVGLGVDVALALELCGTDTQTWCFSWIIKKKVLK